LPGALTGDTAELHSEGIAPDTSWIVWTGGRDPKTVSVQALSVGLCAAERCARSPPITTDHQPHGASGPGGPNRAPAIDFLAP
jgi:hypothetical protein